MHFVSRDFACERLRMSNWASYNVLPSNRLHCVSTDDIIGLLNSSRCNRMPEVDYVPSDICTAEELSESIGIPAAKIKRMARSSRHPIPHWRINKQTMRFSRSYVDGWAARMNKEKR